MASLKTYTENRMNRAPIVIEETKRDHMLNKRVDIAFLLLSVEISMKPYVSLSQFKG